MILVIDYPGCYRVQLVCPKCGQPGLAFLSKKPPRRGQKQIYIYHSGGFSCRVEMREIKELLNRHLP